MTLNSRITFVDNEPAVVTVVHDGEIYTALKDQHAAFDEILEAVDNYENFDFGSDEQDIVDLFDVEKVVAREFAALGDEGRVTVSNGEVFYDGDPMEPVITGQIMRFLNEGLTNRLSALVKFVERVMANPKQSSRDQLFQWLATGDNGQYTLTTDGRFVAYKKVYNNGDVYTSTVAAPDSDRVQVNGVPVTGYVPNPDGAIVTMPRSVVDPAEDVHCSKGLHVGNYRYANTYASGVVLEVWVDPKDVVAVTSDSNREKIRVCRYEVVGPVTERITEPLVDIFHEVEVAPEPAKVAPVADNEIRVGDTVKAVRDILPAHGDGRSVRYGYVPLGSLATVIGVGTIDYEVHWHDSSVSADGQWIHNRFEKVAKSADTRHNHKVQKRDANGRFIPKGATV